jgi:S-adenosylmethionine:tRNA-ribosyltransferase-isomerase (queuine synthetase)
MFNTTNTNKAEKLISKSQSHKSIFAALKDNLSKSNEDMLVEDGKLADKAKEIKLAQDNLKAEVIANENVITNIDSILGA